MSYLSLPPTTSEISQKLQNKRKAVQLPVGTRIKFVKELSSGPDEYSAGNLYAKKDSLGVVTGHSKFEGHWVLWDEWKSASFGASYGNEFIEAPKLDIDCTHSWKVNTAKTSGFKEDEGTFYRCDICNSTKPIEESTNDQHTR